MSRYLLSTCELEDRIEYILKEMTGRAFEREIINTLLRMIDSYNQTQDAYILDCMLDAWQDRMENYLLSDEVCELFIRMVESCYDKSTHRVTLVYDPKQSLLKVDTMLLPRPDPVKNLKEVYHNACVQGDFFPERMRRAFDELAASL